MALIKCEECKHEYDDTLKQCNNCGFKNKHRTKEKLKYKITIIIITVLILVGASISIYIFADKNNENKKFEEIISLLEDEQYTEAINKIKNISIEKTNQEKIANIMLEKMKKYKVENYDDFSQLTEEDWDSIKAINNAICDLDLNKNNDKFLYMEKLLKLEEYKKYVPAINWRNSPDHIAWESYLKLETENDFKKVSSLLPKYSFEKYGIENVYIKELNEAKNNLAKYLKTFAEAIDENNYNKYNSVYDEAIECLTTLLDIETKIITIEAELEENIKKLPAIPAI